jgi:prolipoprotein diacylglyceryl transferase
MGLPVLLCADALAPTMIVAQAIGRWGNYFNQELFGRATDLPWAVEIDPTFRVDPEQATYHPTFLYESLWNLSVAAVCFWADRRFRLGKGRVFALYVALYCLGRGWIEALRVDEAHRFFGLRLNDYVSLALFLASVAYLVLRRGQREPEAELAHGAVPSTVPATDPSTGPVAEPASAPTSAPTANGASEPTSSGPRVSDENGGQ